LPAHQQGDFRVFPRRSDKRRIKIYRIASIAFCLKPAAAGEHLEILAVNGGKFGTHRGVVKPDQNITSPNLVALMHKDLAHDPALGMLDCLPTLFDGNSTRRNDRPGYVCRQPPAAKAGNKNEKRKVAHNKGKVCPPSPSRHDR